MVNVDDFFEEVTHQDLITPAVKDNETGEILVPAVYEERKETVIISRPETKSISDLERVIALGKPEKVINTFAQYVINGEQWQWFDEYQDYLAQCEIVTEYNANLPVSHQDEEGNDVLAEPKDLPPEPTRPTLLTVDEYKALNTKLFDSYNKRNGVEINEHHVSLNESNQNGIAAVLTGLNLASELGANMFPMNFKAESPSGLVDIPFEDLASFKTFALQFMSARQAFFV